MHHDLSFMHISVQGMFPQHFRSPNGPFDTFRPNLYISQPEGFHTTNRTEETESPHRCPIFH